MPTQLKPTIPMFIHDYLCFHFFTYDLHCSLVFTYNYLHQFTRVPIMFMYVYPCLPMFPAHVQYSPPNSNLWGAQAEFDLSDFLNYVISF